MKGMSMTLSNSQASRKKKRQSTLRKRKPKRQGSRAQVGKHLPLRWQINSRLQVQWYEVK